MSIELPIMNEKVLKALDKYFPKGDKARGRALILHAVAQNELEDLQKAYNLAIKEIVRLRRLLGYNKKWKK